MISHKTTKSEIQLAYELVKYSAAYQSKRPNRRSVLVVTGVISAALRMATIESMGVA